MFLGAIGRKSVETAAEIADGWIPIFFSVEAFEDTWGEHIAKGLEKGGRQRSDFEVSPTLQVAIDGDTDAARSVVKAGLMLYFGGMGSRKTNFYVDLAHRFGFGEVADEVQRLYQDGDREGAYAAITDEVADATSLIGTEDEVAERLERFIAAGVDRLIVSPVHPERDERFHTVERLAALAGVKPRLTSHCADGRDRSAPMGERRKQLTYANVMSTLAVFLVVVGGGVAIAAVLAKNSVKSRHIAPGAVKTSDLGRNAATGAKVKESAWRQVPAAAQADNAANAANAATPACSTGSIRSASPGPRQLPARSPWRRRSP